MKDQIYEPNPKVVVFCGRPDRAFGGIAPRKSSNRGQQWLLPYHKAKTSRRIYVRYFFALHRCPKLAANCAMELDYFGSFLQSRRLSIFVVHEIHKRPRCIMESANESLNEDNKHATPHRHYNLRKRSDRTLTSKSKRCDV